MYHRAMNVSSLYHHCIMCTSVGYTYQLMYLRVYYACERMIHVSTSMYQPASCDDSTWDTMLHEGLWASMYRRWYTMLIHVSTPRHRDTFVIHVLWLQLLWHTCIRARAVCICVPPVEVSFLRHMIHVLRRCITRCLVSTTVSRWIYIWNTCIK